MADTKEKTTLSLDRKTKEEGVAVLEQMGIKLSTFVEMGLRQTINEGRLPFTPSLPGSRAPRKLTPQEVTRRVQELNESTPREVLQALASLTPDDERRFGMNDSSSSSANS